MFVCSLRSIGSFAVFAALALYAPTTHAEHGEHVGVFQGHQDVGTVLHPGSAEFDQEHFSYTIAGSGENMWFGEDDFQFAWRKMSGFGFDGRPRAASEKILPPNNADNSNLRSEIRSNSPAIAVAMQVL